MFPRNCFTSVRMIMMGVLGWNLNLYPPAYLCWRLSQVNLRACRCWVADSNPTSVDTAFNLQSLTHVTSSVIIECPGSSTMATELVVAPSSEIKGQLKKNGVLQIFPIYRRGDSHCSRLAVLANLPMHGWSIPLWKSLRELYAGKLAMRWRCRLLQWSRRRKLR